MKSLHNPKLVRRSLDYAVIFAIALSGCGGEESASKKQTGGAAAPAPAPVVREVEPLPASEYESVGLPEINELAKAAEQAGDMEKGRQWRLAAVEKAKAITPLDSNYTDALRSLAFHYHFSGPAEKAEATFLELVKASEQIFGPEDVLVADSVSHLSGSYFYQAKFDAAEVVLARAVAIYEKLYGPNSPQVEKALRNRAECLRRLTREDEAVELEKKADAAKAAIAEAVAAAEAAAAAAPPAQE